MFTTFIGGSHSASHAVSVQIVFVLCVHNVHFCSLALGFLSAHVKCVSSYILEICEAAVSNSNSQSFSLSPMSLKVCFLSWLL